MPNDFTNIYIHIHYFHKQIDFISAIKGDVAHTLRRAPVSSWCSCHDFTSITPNSRLQVMVVARTAHSLEPLGFALLDLADSTTAFGDQWGQAAVVAGEAGRDSGPSSIY